MRFMMWVVMTILLVTFGGCVGFMLDMGCAGSDPDCQAIHEVFGQSITFGLASGAFWLSLAIGVFAIVIWAVKK